MAISVIGVVGVLRRILKGIRISQDNSLCGIEPMATHTDSNDTRGAHLCPVAAVCRYEETESQALQELATTTPTTVNTLIAPRASTSHTSKSQVSMRLFRLSH